MAFLQEVPRRDLVRIPNPAVGADFDITPNRLGAWRVVNMTMTLTTSAVVANRAPLLRLTDGTTIAWWQTTAAVVAGGGSQIFQASESAIPTGNVAGVVQLALPRDGLYMPRGWHLMSVTGLLDVGDQWSAIVLTVQELPDGPDYTTEPSMVLNVIPADG